jgi:ribosomal protein L20A (L18A)
MTFNKTNSEVEDYGFGKNFNELKAIEEAYSRLDEKLKSSRTSCAISSLTESEDNNAIGDSLIKESGSGISSHDNMLFD